VLAFLVMLFYLDNYKLLKPSVIFKAIGFGIFAAVLCYFLNSYFLGIVGEKTLSRYISPVIEESAKAILPLILIRKSKVGFLVDAVIIGFAVGSGFAVTENIYYLYQLSSNNILIWIFRGFGTAIMHGGNTAIFSLITVYLIGLKKNKRAIYFIPGLMVAIIIHSLYNHFYLPPILNTLSQVALLPILLMGAFSYSEKKLAKWLQSGFDSDVKTLAFLKSGKFAQTKQGIYISGFRSSFESEIVLDLICYLRVHLELAIRAKGLLLMRESGMDIDPDVEIKEKFAELKFLEKSIGKSGKAVLKPFMATSQRELWQIYFLNKQS